MSVPPAQLDRSKNERTDTTGGAAAQPAHELVEPVQEPIEVRGAADEAGAATLRRAWVKFGEYDSNSVALEATFRSQQGWILILGTSLTFLVVLKAQLATYRGELKSQGFVGWDEALARADQLLWSLTIAMPILLSALAAGAVRFGAGSRWVLLRGSAEAIKREIYQYRMRAGVYSESDPALGTAAQNLAPRLEDISQRLMKTEVNRRALAPYGGDIPPAWVANAGDDGFSPLVPADYLRLRIEDQIVFYQKRARQIDRTTMVLQWLVLAAGGLGTFLAALGAPLWVAVTTAVTGALTAYLTYRNLEPTLTLYNQTATNLENLAGWWHALSPREQADPAFATRLVEHTEKVLAGEQAGWVQQMHDALATLHPPATVGAGKGSAAAGRLPPDEAPGRPGTP
jgi:hypothetical protein